MLIRGGGGVRVKADLFAYPFNVIQLLVFRNDTQYG